MWRKKVDLVGYGDNEGILEDDYREGERDEIKMLKDEIIKEG